MNNKIQKILFFDQFTSFEELLKSHKRSRRAKRYKYSVIDFENNLFDNLSKLELELKNGTYKVGKYKTFYIYEPKKREIQSLGYRDRIIQHSVCDNFLVPYYDKKLVYCNCACRIGKGTYFARQLLKRYYVEFFKKYGKNGYVLKCDIKKYFANIDHKILKNKLNEIKDKKCVNLLFSIIDSYNKDIEKGLPIGNQVSQILGVVYMDKIDRLIKEILRVKFYVRYMDDLILLSSNKNELKLCLHKIIEELKTLKLELNQKTNISRLKNGLEFLGAKYEIQDTGKIVLKIKEQTKRKFNNKLKVVKFYNSKKLIEQNYIKSQIGGEKGHLKGFNANKMFCGHRTALLSI